jgi:hypothetical protein
LHKRITRTRAIRLGELKRLYRIVIGAKHFDAEVTTRGVKHSSTNPPGLDAGVGPLLMNGPWNHRRRQTPPQLGTATCRN